VRFIGVPENNQLLDLGLVSFKGVDLSNVEFHNVRWLKPKRSFFPRYMIIDEALLGKSKNTTYEEVSKIYNQLRKNYESKLLFNEASNFFIGEMEAIRKSLWNAGTRREKMASIPYFIYKALALYGESYFLPLVIWTPALIGLFIAWRFITGECSLQAINNVISPHITQTCSPRDPFIDSFAAYFQFPRSTINAVDTIERIVSIPILGTAFIAINSKFTKLITSLRTATEKGEFQLDKEATSYNDIFDAFRLAMRFFYFKSTEDIYRKHADIGQFEFSRRFSK
jgi:hypothetical protein